MTPRQLERRRRVIAAVQELVDEGRVRDLQVKEIGERAGVSLAAIYRYFSSKEHILAEALLEWARRFTDRRRPSGNGAEYHQPSATASTNVSCASESKSNPSK